MRLPITPSADCPRKRKCTPPTGRSSRPGQRQGAWVAVTFANRRKAHFLWPLLLLFLGPGVASAQQIPDVRCKVEDYSLGAPLSWQSTESLASVQVVVLRDPAAEQEARFDLTHGAALVSLRYRGKELLFGHSAGASVGMYVFRHGTEPELKGLSPFWSSFHPDQGGTSMGVPASSAGVACRGERSMRAFAMMIDGSVDSSFQRQPLLGVWKGRLSDNFPPGYSVPYTIETNASWIPNPGKTPSYYLRLDQTVVKLRPGSSGSMDWFLEGAAPWEFEQSATDPEQCTEKTPCSGAQAPVLAIGRYGDKARTIGFATVVPTASWQTDRAYTLENSEFAVLAYGAVWVAPRHQFATVLSRPMEGVGGFHFGWYICAGSWDSTRAFARQLPR